MPDALTSHADVLLVDDDADLLEGLEYLLEAAGYGVRSAPNGLEGLRLARELTPPFVIVLDLHMPVLNGYDMLEQLQRDPQLSALPVIVITARMDFHPPGVDVLQKPFESAELIQLVAARSPRRLRARG